MLNDIAQIPLDFLDWLYENPFIGAYFDMWEDLGDAISSYSGTLTNLLEGVYFIFTKDWIYWAVDHGTNHNLNKIANTSTGLETLLAYMDIDSNIK